MLEVLAVPILCLALLSAIVWVGYDTHRNLVRRYPQATEADIDKFLRENEGLMNDLASGEMPFDSVWILSYEMWLENAFGGTWVRVREGVLLSGPTAYTHFEKLQKRIEENPLYMRNAVCERAKVIR